MSALHAADEQQGTTIDAVLMRRCEGSFDTDAQLRHARNTQAVRISLSSLMVCPVSGEPFSPVAGSLTEPCRLPTCGCLMTRAMAQVCIDDAAKCPLCPHSCDEAFAPDEVPGSRSACGSCAAMMPPWSSMSMPSPRSVLTMVGSSAGRARHTRARCAALWSWCVCTSTSTQTLSTARGQMTGWS
jgi:hypothetical protein